MKTTLNRLNRCLAPCVAMALSAGATLAHADGERLAVFTKNLTNPHFQNVRLGAEAGAKAMNATVTQYVPTKPDSIPEQLSQIDDVVVKKPDSILFVPVDYKALNGGIAKMNAAGIPVVNVGDRAEQGNFVSFVGASDYDLGLQTGKTLAQTLGAKGGGVVILEGVRGTITNTDRVKGFRDALKDNPNIKVLASQPAAYQRLQALQVMENLMQTHPDIAGVMAANDAMATGAVEALEGANRKALVVGINGTKEAVDLVKAGKMLATGDYAGFYQGCFGAMVAIRNLRKQPVPKEIVFPGVSITKANFAQFDVPTEKRSCPKWEEFVK
jgi:ribose transport system substrate-binding protein